MNLTRKLIAAHLVAGEMVPGEEIGIKIDQTLTQDATGTLAYLMFEAMGLPRVKTELSVSYVDHQLLQVDTRNADDHTYLQDVAYKHGIHYSKPGNGICHQIHLERFSRPGDALLGSDSHTPTCGGVGMLALGAGGQDVACAMAGLPFYLRMPKVLGIELRGKLQPWVASKDVILEVLRRLSVKGGVGHIFEYYGPGAASLEVTDRATISNMGAEAGATTSIFASDEKTRRYFAAQGREDRFRLVGPDPGADYDEHLVIDLDQLGPLVAKPHMPDNVVPIEELLGMPVDQVAIGSCTNSSYQDLMVMARILKGRIVHPKVNAVCSPGSRQVYNMIAQNGALADLIAAGVRMLESSCGPCPGLGAVPQTGAISLRAFNRNFEGRCGAPGINVYLASPVTCAAAAVAGKVIDPRTLTDIPHKIRLPKQYLIDDRMIIPPADDGADAEIRRGPNIKPIPTRAPMDETIHGTVLTRVGDNISTDGILPAHANILALRSNVPAISDHVFKFVDPTFVGKAKERGGGIIVAGQNYGQGSSREHAALAPSYLGVKAVIAKGFARIHRANLTNFGVLPLSLVDETDYDLLDPDDRLAIPDVRAHLASGESEVPVDNLTKGRTILTRVDASDRQRHLLLVGGLLNSVRAAGLDGASDPGNGSGAHEPAGPNSAHGSVSLSVSPG
ncbi:MAG: aconitate hydratase [Chloroflexi bacterium]|nr:aconitate hydratase [Chloroflexota bacterium]